MMLCKILIIYILYIFSCQLCLKNFTHNNYKTLRCVFYVYTVQCHVYYSEWLRTGVVHVTHDIGMQNITRKLVANISPDFPCVLKAKCNRAAITMIMYYTIMYNCCFVGLPTPWPVSAVTTLILLYQTQ